MLYSNKGLSVAIIAWARIRNHIKVLELDPDPDLVSNCIWSRISFKHKKCFKFRPFSINSISFLNKRFLCILKLEKYNVHQPWRSTEKILVLKLYLTVLMCVSTYRHNPRLCVNILCSFSYEELWLWLVLTTKVEENWY